MPNPGEIYQSTMSVNKFIRLERLNGNLWDYREYNGPVEGMNARDAWTSDQIENRKPGMSEWTLSNHYRRYTAETVITSPASISGPPKVENAPKVIYGITDGFIYFSKRKLNTEDVIVPDEILQRLHLSMDCVPGSPSSNMPNGTNFFNQNGRTEGNEELRNPILMGQLEEIQRRNSQRPVSRTLSPSEARQMENEEYGGETDPDGMVDGMVDEANVDIDELGQILNSFNWSSD